MSQENNSNNNNTSQEKEKKKSSFSPVRIVILVVCLGIFAFSGYKIIGEFIDGAETDDMINDLLNTVRGDDDDPGDNTGSDADNFTPDEAIISNKTDSENKTPENSTPAPGNDNNSVTSPTEPEIYDDRTYEEELAEEQQAQQDPTTSPGYSVSRPSADKSDDSTMIGTVIAPEDINVSTVPYLKASNLKRLLNTNDETKGWIYFPGSTAEAKGTPIDTAIVQTTDNEYYLTHSFDKSENINGWIYADARVNMEKITSNYNTVIYGHARSYKMFGGLKELNTSVDWYSNGYNHFIKINTFNDETVWQIFSWYETDVYYDYIKTEFDSAEDFIRFAYEVQDKNQMEGIFETFEFGPNDRILTLSTCKGLDRTVRVAVHAKLVRRNKIEG